MGIEENKDIFDLTGRIALITGAGSGLGREIAITMAKYGADVVCIGRTEDKLQETIKLLDAYSRRTMAIKADVSKPEEIDYLVNETISIFGAIDILFNNAGINYPTGTRIGDMPIEDWDEIIGINLRGVFLCMRAILPIMVKQKRGSIINISSVAAYGNIEPESIPPAYGVSKAGVVLLTKCAAHDYAKDGIRVNSIAPGLHNTGLGPLSDPALADEVLSIISTHIPMGRMGEPDEIEGLAVFLASDASSYVTGQVFVQDGGIMAKI